MGFARVKTDAELEREMFARIELRGRGARFRSAQLAGNPMDYFVAKSLEVVAVAIEMALQDFHRYKPDYPFGDIDADEQYIRSFDVNIIHGVRPGIRLSNDAPHAQIVESGRDGVPASAGHVFALPVKNTSTLRRKAVMYRGKPVLMTVSIAAFSGHQIIQRALRRVFS